VTTSRKGDVKTGKGYNSAAEDEAKKLGLTKTSGYRSEADNKRVGGTKTSDHLTGNATDYAGSAKEMLAYAQWAAKSGLFTKVIYGGRDWISGRVDKEHDDHVHVSWVVE
jgi:hypothetical protein